MKPAILGLFLVALTVSGCQSVPPQPRDLVNEEEEKAFIVKRGIDQMRDPDTGESYHVICEACAKPTIKSRYRPPLPVASTMAPAVPDQANPIPVLVHKAVPVPVPTSVTESAAQSAVIKHLVPFAFGRSKLGPQGRDAMDDILAVAREAVFPPPKYPPASASTVSRKRTKPTLAGQRIGVLWFS